MLCQFFQQHKIIRRAFLLQAEDDTAVEASVMLIALEINIGYEKEGQLLIPQLGSMALDYLEDNQSVDFYFLQPNNIQVSIILLCAIRSHFINVK